ncbi:hypothetical protein, partial [Gaoshiqia sediminis]
QGMKISLRLHFSIFRLLRNILNMFCKLGCGKYNNYTDHPCSGNRRDYFGVQITELAVIVKRQHLDKVSHNTKK